MDGDIGTSTSTSTSTDSHVRAEIASMRKMDFPESFRHVESACRAVVHI